MRPKTIPSSTPLVKKLDFKNSRHSFAFLYVTNACNLTCIHCAFQSARHNSESHMETELILRAVEELSGIHDITITGGEPLLHPGFKEILSYAAKHASIVYLMTNGINLVGNVLLKKLALREDRLALIKMLKEAMGSFPENLHIFFPLDSFHMKACKEFKFLLKCLAEIAYEWNNKPIKPYIGLLSNEVSQQKSARLIEQFKVASYCHVGTAAFSPWRNAKNIQSWYLTHPLNQMPFPGGLYINYKGVYLNEASLLLDLREGIETPFKIGTLNTASSNKQQLYDIYKQASI